MSSHSLFAFPEGKPIPTELRKDEAALRKAIEFDDEKHEGENTFVAVICLNNKCFIIVFVDRFCIAKTGNNNELVHKQLHPYPSPPLTQP